MTEERDQPAGAAHGTRGLRETADPGPKVAFLPPVDVTIDVPDFRYAKLSRVVAENGGAKLDHGSGGIVLLRAA